MAADIFAAADEHFYDTRTEMLVAVKSVVFRGRSRLLALVYAMTERGVTFVTLHPMRESQLANRIDTGRWVPHEPEGSL